MLEMHLKQPGFAYTSCGPFAKNKERIEKIMQTGNTNFIDKNELEKACFEHDMAKRDKAFESASDQNYGGYKKRLASMVYKVFDKKSTLLNKSSASGTVNEPKQQLANKLHKPIIRKF